MSLMWKRRDGGEQSNVFAYGLEIKSMFSVLFLSFSPGSREAYHSHAFNAVSWLLSGRLKEYRRFERADSVTMFTPSLWPLFTSRENTHRVESQPWPASYTWVLSFRGPWQRTWTELRNNATECVTLTHGRKEVSRA